jgi:DNA-binding transcriptional LysR family regulator
LAYSPPPCVSRHIAVDALNAAGIAWHGAFSSHSLQDMRSAVLSGLAVTAFTQDNLRPGMVALRTKHGFPALPKLDYTLAQGDVDLEGRRPAVAELGGLVMAYATA